MVTFKMEIVLDFPFILKAGRDVTWNIPNCRLVYPEKAIATGDYGAWGNIVELTFRDDDHLEQWRKEMGKGRDEIETLIGRPLVY